MMLYLNNNHINILTKNVPCPERLNIELTTHCNLRCIMCRGKQNYVKEHKQDRHLTVNEFVNFLKGVDLNRLKILNLAGNSEPLLNPDIIQIVSICRELRIIVELITNGMLLTPEISKHLLGCSSEIHISFAGSNKKTHESIRQGSDFDQICANIRFLSTLKSFHNIQFPKIWLNPILMKRNIQELPEIIDLAKKLGCDGVASSHLIVSSPELIGESLFLYKDECNYFLNETQQIAKQNGISLVGPECFSDIDNGDKIKCNRVEAWRICRFLWNHAILGIETLMPCSGAGKEIDFDGNVFRTRFMDIWNNDWYANMRYRLLTGNPPGHCKDCTDPSVKDVNHIGSYFIEDILPEAIAYSQTLPALSFTMEFERKCQKR